MPNKIYKYQFDEGVSMDVIESQFALAIIVGETLFGQPTVMLDCDMAMDTEQRVLVLHVGSEVSLTVQKVFIGLLNREVGKDNYSLVRIEPESRRSRRRRRKSKKPNSEQLHAVGANA